MRSLGLAYLGRAFARPSYLHNKLVLRHSQPSCAAFALCSLLLNIQIDVCGAACDVEGGRAAKKEAGWEAGMRGG